MTEVESLISSSLAAAAAEEGEAMWPVPLDWEEKRFQKSNNISLAGEAGIADANYLSSLVQSTNVGVGQLSGLAMQWESSHNNALRLLREELSELASQREEAESKRRRILDDGAFYVDSKRSVLDKEIVEFSSLLEDHHHHQQQQQWNSKKVGNLICSNSLDSDDETRPGGESRDYWKQKARKLNQLLAESLQREEMLLKKLQELHRTSSELESSAAVPVFDLQNQLQRVDNFLHFVLRNAPIVMAHQDKDLKYRFVYNQYPGYQSEVIGKTDLELIPEATETYEFKREVLSRGCPAKREFTYETKEFGLKAFLLCVEPVFSKDGVTIGINTISMEVTEEFANREKLVRLREETAVQRAMETQLHKTMQITEETMKAKQLLATMSHEIRSPLSGVVSMAEILAATNLDPEQKNLVDIMVSSGDLVLQLINDILDLSKVESGAMRLEATKFRPREVVANVLQMAAASMQKRNLTLEGSVATDVPLEVIGDVLRVRQILTNLVSNATKFTPSGSVKVIVEVIPHNKTITTSSSSASKQNSVVVVESSSSVPQWVNNDTVWLQFQVKDTGIGIPDAALPFLFTKYMQVSETHARKYGGTGLGLAICKQLVELMGGKLIVSSEEKKGSTFLFTLPCKLSSTSSSIRRSSSNSSSFSFTSGAKLFRTSNGGSSNKSCKQNVSDQETKATSNGSSAVPHQQSSPSADHQSNGKVIAWKALSNNNNVYNRVGLKSSLDMLSSCTSTKTTTTTTTSSSDGVGKMKLNILLAEDSKVNVLVAQSMLRRLGLQATVVNNGAEAVEAVKREFYELILMDVCMPVMDGLEATRLIREFQRSSEGRRSGIVAMTANALPENVAECYAHGMDSFVAKPVTFSKLQQVIQQFQQH